MLVGIVTRNRATILPKAIQSALSQDCPNVRVAVLDDASDGVPHLTCILPFRMFDGTDGHRRED